MDYLLQSNSPLFPKLLWNRPVSRATAGTLMVIGGRPGDFATLTNFYQVANAAGIGRCRVVLPDSLRPILAGAPDTTFLPSGSGGGLGREALEPILALALDCTVVAIGPGLGHSSDVGILVEALLSRLELPVALMGDALKAIRTHWQLAVERPGRLIVANMPELVQWAGWMGLPLKFENDQAQGKLSILRTVAGAGQADYFVPGVQTLARAGGQDSLTPCRLEFDRSVDEALTTVFWAQNQAQPFEGLTTAAFIMQQIGQRSINADSLTINQIKAVIKHLLTDGQ